MKLEFVALFIAVTLSCALSSGVSQDGTKSTKDLMASETADAQLLLPPVKGKLVQTFTYNSRDLENVTEEQNVTVSDGKRKMEVVPVPNKILPNKIETSHKLPSIEPIRKEGQNYPTQSHTPPDLENISLPLSSPPEKETGKVNIKNIVVYNLTQEELERLKNSDNKNRLDILKSISQKGGTVIKPFHTGNKSDFDSRKREIASMFLRSALKRSSVTSEDLSSISRRFSSAPPILIKRNGTDSKLLAQEKMKNSVKISSRDSIPPEIVQLIMQNIPSQLVNQKTYQNQKRENQQLTNENSQSSVQTNHISKSQNGQRKQQMGTKKQQSLKRQRLLPKPVSQMKSKHSLVRNKKLQPSSISRQRAQPQLIEKSDQSSQTQLLSNYERNHFQFDQPEKKPIHTLSENTEETYLSQRNPSEQQDQSQSIHLHKKKQQESGRDLYQHGQPKREQSLKLAPVQKNYPNLEQSSGKAESREIKSQVYESNPVNDQLAERTKDDLADKQHQKRDQNDILDSYLNQNIQTLPRPQADTLGEAAAFPIHYAPEIEVRQINIPSLPVAPSRQFESLTRPIHPRFQQCSPRTSTVFVPQTVTVTQTVTKTVANGISQGLPRLPVTFTKTETLYPPIRAPFLSNALTETVFVKPTACTHAPAPVTNLGPGTSSYVDYYGENLQHPVIDPPETYKDWVEETLSAESPFFIDQYGVPRNEDALTGPTGMRFPKSFVIDERIWQI